jgi:hypothetical protein
MNPTLPILPRCRLLLAGFFVSLLTANLFATATGTLVASATRTSGSAISGSLTTSGTDTMYLRFKVDGLMASSSVITKVTLRLHRRTGNSALIIKAANNSQGNSDSTALLWWNSTGSLDLHPPKLAQDAISGTTTITPTANPVGNFVDVDITAQYITGDGYYSFAITSGAINTYTSNSWADPAYRPQLMIEDAITLDKATFASAELLEQGNRIAERYDIGTSGAPNLQSYFYKYGVIDATKQPYGAASNANAADNRFAIQRALNDALLARAVVYLPPGTYKVSDTIEMVQGAIDRLKALTPLGGEIIDPTLAMNMVRHDTAQPDYTHLPTPGTDFYLERWNDPRTFGNALIGKPGAPAVLKLDPGAVGFNVSPVIELPDPQPIPAVTLVDPKPVLKIWSRWDRVDDTNGDNKVDALDFWDPAEGAPAIDANRNRSAVNYNQTVRNINIDLSDTTGFPANNHQGAVGITTGTAQGGTITDCVIDATGAFAGVFGSAGPSGGMHNVTVNGGKYGLCVAEPQDGQQLLLSACTFDNQTVKAITWRGLGGLTIVGTNFFDRGIEVKAGNSAYDGMLCLVDSKFDFSASPQRAVDSNRGVYMNRVYVKNGAPVITPAPGFPPPTPTPTTNLLTSTGWILINEYAGGISIDQNPHNADSTATPVPYYIDGTPTTNATLVSSQTFTATVPNVQAAHGWGATPFFLDCEGATPTALNVAGSPYFAKGDGVSDDTVAFESALTTAQAAGKDVFVPKGDYRISRSLHLTGSIKLFGIHKNYTIIQSSYRDRHINPSDFYGTALGAKPLIIGEGASCMLSDLTLKQRMTDACSYLLNWKAGSASIVKNVTFLRQPMISAVTDIQESESAMILVEGAATGGKFYHLWGVASSQHETNNYPTSTSPARHLKVSGTTQPLAFYMANFEYAHNLPQVEITGAQNVNIYQAKFEGNYRNLHIKNSSNNIRLFGVGGNACPFPNDVGTYTTAPYANYEGANQNILIEGSSNYLVAGQSYQGRKPDPIDGYDAQVSGDFAGNNAVYKTSVGAATDPTKYKRLKDDPSGPTPPTVTTSGEQQFVLYKRGTP